MVALYRASAPGVDMPRVGGGSLPARLWVKSFMKLCEWNISQGKMDEINNIYVSVICLSVSHSNRVWLSCNVASL